MRDWRRAVGGACTLTCYLVGARASGSGVVVVRRGRGAHAVSDVCGTRAVVRELKPISTTRLRELQREGGEVEGEEMAWWSDGYRRGDDRWTNV